MAVRMDTEKSNTMTNEDSMHFQDLELDKIEQDVTTAAAKSDRVVGSNATRQLRRGQRKTRMPPRAQTCSSLQMPHRTRRFDSLSSTTTTQSSELNGNASLSFGGFSLANLGRSLSTLTLNPTTAKSDGDEAHWRDYRASLFQKAGESVPQACNLDDSSLGASASTHTTSSAWTDPNDSPCLQKLQYSQVDVLKILEDPKAFATMKNSLRQQGAVTNGLCRQNIHFYVSGLRKVQEQQSTGSSRSGRHKLPPRSRTSTNALEQSQEDSRKKRLPRRRNTATELLS